MRVGDHLFLKRESLLVEGFILLPDKLSNDNPGKEREKGRVTVVNIKALL